MASEDLSTRKRVPISRIRGGDVRRRHSIGPGCNTPFIFHHKLIKGDEDIAIFERNGIREVIIDTARGADIDESALQGQTC